MYSFIQILITSLVIQSCSEPPKFSSHSAVRGENSSTDGTDAESLKPTNKGSAKSGGEVKNGIEKYTKPYLTSPLEKSESKVSISEEKLPAGTKMVGVFKYDELKNSFEKYRDDITTSIKFPTNPKMSVIGNEFVAEFTLKSEITKKNLKEILAVNSAIVAITVNQEVVPAEAVASPREDERTAGIDSNVKSSVVELGESVDSRKVKVAVIDTGLDSSGVEFAKSFKSNPYLNIFSPGNDPADESGHGTQVASIIGSKKFGIVEPIVEIMPIKVTKGSTVSVSTLAEAIVTATNLGADVVNLSLSGEAFGCTPVVGHIIFKAIEKGVFFSISSGNGKKHLPEVEIGFPVIAPQDDGPLNFQRTAMPACWGKYFLGAVAVGAVAEDGKESKLKMPLFSNYGEDVEILAPGVGVPVVSLKDASSKMTGTSASAAYVSAAAAIAIFHHRQKDFKYTPWYIENLLVESAEKNSSLNDLERRSRFSSVLSFRNLLGLLKSTESMDHDERQKIPTVNPRYLDGWIPGKESRLDRLNLETAETILRAGPDVAFESVLFFKNGEKEKRITTELNSSWGVSLVDTKDVLALGNSKPYLRLSGPGKLVLSKSNLDLMREKLALARKVSEAEVKDVKIALINTYDEQQHQVNGIIPVSIEFEKVESVPDQLQIVLPNSLFRVGQTQNIFKVNLTKKNKDGTTVVDVTGSAVWKSSSPSEFALTNSAGVFSAENAFHGKKYTITATASGLTTSATVTIENETLQKYEVLSSLGSDGEITVGQVFKLTSQAVFQSRKQPVKADWYVGTSKIASGVQEFEVDTTMLSQGVFKNKALTLGANQITAKAMINGVSVAKEYSTIHSFKIVQTVSKIEVSLKDPIVKEGGELLLNVKAYFDNNSYQVITLNEGVTWSNSHPQIVNIQPSGKATIALDSKFTNVTVGASYKGKTASTSFYIVTQNPVTGSSSGLIDLEVLGRGYTGSSYCQIYFSGANAFYLDGLKRDVSEAITKSVVRRRNGGIIPFDTNDLGRPNDEVELHAAYNDGNTAGGAISRSKILKLPFGSGEDIVTWKDGSTTRKIEAPSRAIPDSDWKHQELKIPECVVNFAFKFDKNYKDSSGNFIVGNYKMTVEWDAYGSGQKVHHTKILTLQVVPEELRAILELYGRGSISVINGRTLGTLPPRSFGFYPTPVEYSLLFDLFNSYSPLKEFRGGEFATLKSSAVVASNSIPSNHKFISYNTYRVSSCIDYSKSASGSLTLSNLTNTVAAEKPFTTTASFDLSQKMDIVKSTPVLKIPVRNPAASFCNTVNKKLSPVAGGDGTKENPYRICSPQQLVAGYAIAVDSIKTANDVKYINIETDLDLSNFDVRYTGEISSSRNIVIDGRDHLISNLTMIDSEKNSMGLFTTARFIKNLFVKNFVVRGNSSVGAVCGGCSLERVYGESLVVYGTSSVGGLAGISDAVNDSGALDSAVYTLQGQAGGLTGSGVDIHNSFFSGKVIHIGVPDAGSNIGGLTGFIENVTNSRMSGTVSGSGTNVGGIVGEVYNIRRSVILYNLVEGTIVNAGESTGGIVGSMRTGQMTAFLPGVKNWTYSRVNDKLRLGGDPATNELEIETLRQFLLMGNSFKGLVIGGRSREALYCIDGIKEVLGEQGSISCIGDQLSESVQGSATGGIVGKVVNGLMIRDNFVEGKVRSVNESGGLVGRQDWLAPIIGNTVKAQVSVSSATGNAGKFFGVLLDNACAASLKTSQMGAFIKSNTANNGQSDLADIGLFHSSTGSALNQNFSQ